MKRFKTNDMPSNIYYNHTNRYHPGYFQYNNHNHHQQRPGGYPPRQDSNVGPNHILLITVINPAYPITCEVIHTICQPHGKVLRIVIFKKNGIQAMVEFDSIESAKRAKQALHGCDIYSGCCTLRIEFAKVSPANH